MTIRLIAIDLDGTLLNDSKHVTDQTVASLALAVERGVKVVIASARPPRSVRKIYQQLKLDTLQINYNGAMIWDEPNQTVFYHLPMPGDVVLKLIRRARAMHEPLVVHCEILDRWHTDRENSLFQTETGRLFKPDVIAPLETICGQPITKLNLMGDPAVIAAMEPVLIKEFGDQIAMVRASERELLLGMNRLAGKSHALIRVAEHYDVPMANVMAIGDAPNDVGMLQVAGLSIAMANAHPRVKEVADWIAPSNNDHGVHAALQQFVL